MSIRVRPAEKASGEEPSSGLVTIRRVVRRVLADGTVDTVTYNVQVKPERVLGNGDVVVKRQMRRAKDDGSGTELLTVMQVIPRARQNPLSENGNSNIVAMAPNSIVPSCAPKGVKSVMCTNRSTPENKTEMAGVHRDKISNGSKNMNVGGNLSNLNDHDDVSTNLTSDSDGDASALRAGVSDEADEVAGKRTFELGHLLKGRNVEDDDDGASSLPDVLDRASRLSDGVWGGDDLRRCSSARSKTDLFDARGGIHSRAMDGPIWEDRSLYRRGDGVERGLKSRGDGWRWGLSRTFGRREDQLRELQKTRAEDMINEIEAGKRRGNATRMLPFHAMWRRASSREASPMRRKR